jgi:cbb3-type cytochrome oxidase subunit 3
VIDFIVNNSGLICLVGFFAFFGVTAIWAMLPGNKKKFESYKNIPLEDENGR